MASQVYRNVDSESSRVDVVADTPSHAHDHGTEEEEEEEDATMRTCQEGDTGYVDLEHAFQPGSPSSTAAFDELLASPQTELRMTARKRLPVGSDMLETPSIAGQKHDRSGEILTSVKTDAKQTPGFSQLFGQGFKAPVMSATQLFNQTQAPSSPLPDGPRSDPAITRPSPNIANQYALSSPPPIFSSPLVTVTKVRPSSSAGEPRGDYISMRESQDRRAARLRKELGLHALGIDNEEDSDDDGMGDVIQRRFERARMRKAKSDEAAHELRKVRAPLHRGVRPSSSSKVSVTIDLTKTPGTVARDSKKVSEKYPESNADESGNSEAEQVEGEGEDDNDEYDELGQTILRSQANDQDEDVSMGENEVEDIESVDDGEDSRPDLYPDTHRQHTAASTQRSAIADSQPNGHDGNKRSLARTAGRRSSMSSFVPGSQYDAGTNQDKLRLGSTPLEVSNDKAASRISGNAASSEEKVPSSPPVLATSNTFPTTSSEMPSFNQNVLRGHHRSSLLQNDSTMTEQQVPESDLPVLHPHHISKYDNSREASGDANDPHTYSTAKTHVSHQTNSGNSNVSIAASPIPTLVSQHSKLSEPSPRKAAGVRHFSEIAAEQMRPDSSAEADVDVDSIMNGVMTVEDQEYVVAISDTPALKRQNVSHSKFQNNAPEAKQAGPSNTSQEVPPTMGDDQGLDVGDKTSTYIETRQALRNSPSKANELPKSTPQESKLPESTPESVKKREAAGQQAVSQLLSTRKAKAKPITYGRNANRQGRKTKAPIKRMVSRTIESTIDGVRNTNSSTGDKNTVAVKENQVEQDKEKIMPMGTISAPERVFALFKGQYNSFYPATWIGYSPEGLSYKIRFDDESIITLDAQHVRRLDLRIGDQVKVDGPGMRTKSWSIVGFGDVATTDQDRSLGVDIYGRTRVKLQARSGRGSSSKETAILSADEEAIETHVSNLYLTHTLWTHYQDRAFEPPSNAKGNPSRYETPSTREQTPDDDAPGSRSRRPVAAGAKVLSGRPIKLREESIASSASNGNAGLFRGMAFAITYTHNDSERAEVTRLIQKHGGIILETGFDELFDLAGLVDSTAPSALKPSPRKSEKGANAVEGLRLKVEYTDIGFVALIADQYSRRAKYMQALALGLPTLSGRWIIDSVKASNQSTEGAYQAAPLSWDKYLLSAGESSYLGGAVRSRSIVPGSSDNTKLSTTISSRHILMDGGGVLFVSSKKNKLSWERRKVYVFLILALGAGYVKRVGDIQEAKNLMVEQSDFWRWVSIDSSISDATAELFGKSKTRKLGGSSTDRDDQMSASNGQVKIVNDEFVVQSLILGALVD